MPSQLINNMFVCFYFFFLYNLKNKNKIRMKKLHVLITAKNSRKKGSAAATENAISSFAKAIEFKSACLENEKAAGE
jgi:hypothetical protein